ncbi:DDHD domain-containing protein [Syncephalis plumigaleata]|nr:DDHD domain-containing protein [Syncephalis plumigaleata]
MNTMSECPSPYITQSVIFTSARGAWLLSGNFAESIVAKFTKGENLGGIKLVRGWDEVEPSKVHYRVNRLIDSMRTSIRAVSIFKSLTKEAKEQADNADTTTTSSAEQTQNSRPSMSADPRVLLEQLNYSGRVDWCLQEGLLENEYLTGLQVHFNYWSDVDIAAFLLRECTRD